MKKNLVIGLIVILIISVLGLIFSGRKKDSQIEETKIFPISQKESAMDLNESWTTNYKLPAEGEARQGRQATSSSLDLIFKQTFLEQNRKTFKEIGIKFEEVKQSLKQAIKLTGQPFSLPSRVSSTAPQKTAPTLSEKEIFAKLYPNYFIDGLTMIQNFFLEQGFLGANYQKIENFDSEEKILSFVNAEIDVFEKQGWTSTKEASKFRKGANEIWKDLMEKEKLELQGKLIKSEFYKNIFASKIHYLDKSISKKILAEFKEKMLPKAHADYVNSWDCYKSGLPLPGIGANLWAPCCDCGINCGRKSCWDIVHCGFEGCLVNFGCLNLFARFFPAAIWDELTGICGVG